MANTVATSPQTMANVTVAGSFFSWINPDNAKVSDDIYVTSSNGIYPLYDKVVSLVLADGSYGLENKKTGVEWVEDANTYFSYGSGTDLWGETLTSEDVNDADFGVILQTDQNGGSYSDILKANNFGFAIPIGSTIDGVLVEIERNYTGGRPHFPQIDHIRITIYYTEATTTTSTSSSTSSSTSTTSTSSSTSSTTSTSSSSSTSITVPYLKFLVDRTEL